MNLLNLENISKSYGERFLFKNANFTLDEGEKVGIIGINGTGKSTLLRIIAGAEEADEGKITIANHVVIRFLTQHPVFKEGATVLECVLEGNVTEQNKWSIESEAKSMLNELGIMDFDAIADTLSGGQRKRIALAQTLLSDADILILDEPTNHLDTSMADWLEQYLKSFKGALVMVTHDRYFLDSVSNRIVEIDKSNIYSYQANYSGFLALKAEREEMELATERKRQSILRVELEWMKRGARARSTKQKARIERYETLRDQKGPQTDGTVDISSVYTRMGKTTVELSHLSKAYGDKVLLRDFNYIFLKNDRIGFIGENGCGKSTLMKMLIGKVQPDEGDITIGQTIKIGYYAQEIESVDTTSPAYMNPNKRVIDYIRDTAEFVRTADGSVSASKMLEKFLFEGEEQYSLIGKLSGGEKRRLNLLRVLMEEPNVLILDEPTNDLDIKTLTILEDYLDYFEGIVIIVSHDRYFLDRTVRRIFAFEGNGKVTQYEGGYTDYQARVQELEGDTDSPKKPVEKEKSAGRKTWNKEQKLKFTWQEKKDYETIDSEIADLEEKISSLEAQMLKCASDFVKLNELTKEKEDAEALLEEKMERWMYLSELAEKIESQNN